MDAEAINTMPLHDAVATLVQDEPATPASLRTWMRQTSSPSSPSQQSAFCELPRYLAEAAPTQQEGRGEGPEHLAWSSHEHVPHRVIKRRRSRARRWSRSVPRAPQPSTGTGLRSASRIDRAPTTSAGSGRPTTETSLPS